MVDLKWYFNLKHSWLIEKLKKVLNIFMLLQYLESQNLVKKWIPVQNVEWLFGTHFISRNLIFSDIYMEGTYKWYISTLCVNLKTFQLYRVHLRWRFLAPLNPLNRAIFTLLLNFCAVRSAQSFDCTAFSEIEQANNALAAEWRCRAGAGSW